MEGLYTAIADEFPICRKHTLITRITISALPFLTCIPTVTYAGIYIVQWFDTFAISPSLLVVVFAETLTVCWFYGLDKFCGHIYEMNANKLHMYWRLSWKFLCPLVLITIVILDIIFFQGLSYGDYVFPNWSVILGYTLNLIALLPIPGYAFGYFIYNKYFKK